MRSRNFSMLSRSLNDSLANGDPQVFTKGLSRNQLNLFLNNIQHKSIPNCRNFSNCRKLILRPNNIFSNSYCSNRNEVKLTTTSQSYQHLQPLQRRSFFGSSFYSSSTVAETVKKPRRLRNFLIGSTVGLSALSAYLIQCRLEQEAKVSKILSEEVEVPIPTRAEQLKAAKKSSESKSQSSFWGSSSGSGSSEESDNDNEYDILIIGGGATGSGVALDAATRGLKVCCIEQEDFASGTSSKSTKLLWAGSRYLVKGMVKLFSPSSLLHPIASIEEFRGTWNMVMGCFRERTYMLMMNPHLSYWVPIAVPLKTWTIWPPPFDYPPAALGPCTGLFVFFFKFYDMLSLFTAPSSYVMTSSGAREKFPQLDGPNMKYVSVFYEGAHNDARTNTAIALTAMTKGATVLNYMRADSIIYNRKTGKAEGAVCTDLSDRDNISNSSDIKIKAKKVIFCGGPFTDQLRKMAEGEDVKNVVNGSGGTHIVLPQYYCPRDIGMVDMMTSRGSFLFFLPWQGYTLVGTTDVKNSEPKLHNRVPEDEVQYLVNECERYLSPFLKVRRRDVMSAWYGTRPLCVDPHAADQSSVSRDHVISHHPDNDITFISGGKWTTWREMAEDCVDQVLERNSKLKVKAGECKTLEIPLIGGGKTEKNKDGYHENLGTVLCQKFDLAPEIAQHLVATYGTRADDVLACVDQSTVKESRSGLYKHYRRIYDGAATNGYPYLEAEVIYAIRHEHALTAADILCRRTRLAFLNSNAAHLITDKVVDLMGDELGWSKSRRKLEIEETHKMLHKDFLGPIPNKEHATLRAACVADVKQAFDEQDGALKNGRIHPKYIGKIADKLGFPLETKESSSPGPGLRQAMKELDPEDKGYVTFQQVLNWWNNHPDVHEQHRIMASEEIEDKVDLSVPIQRMASIPSVFATK